MTKQTTLAPPEKKTGMDGNASSKSNSSAAKSSTQSLEILFEKELKDMYSAEKQLVEALPKLAEAADSEDLQDAILNHLEETKRHVQRIEKVFERLQITKGEEKCLAMEGMIKEAEKVLQDFERSPVRDSALIIGAQKVEHYEIASYGSLCELADVLGYGKVNDILGRTLDEEENADQELSEIAQNVNDDAYEQSRNDRRDDTADNEEKEKDDEY
jgi:ferritin-like metal-binding protein YciE